MAAAMRAVSAFLVVAGYGAGCTQNVDLEEPERGSETASYVGGERCATCHQSQAELWNGSHHDLAMQPAEPATVLGDFDSATFDYGGVTTTFFERDGGYHVRTDGPSGELEEYEVAYTFGVDPLQQYLLAFPDGRYQALSIAWDSRSADEGGDRWFHLYPDDAIDHESPLHWTKRVQGWNFMCASCHSTGLRKNYDAASSSYRTEWSEIDVSCEACHGPGSKHAAWAERGGGGDPLLEVDLRTDDASWVMDVATGLSERVPARTEHFEIETCAPCHSRRSQLQESDPRGQPFLDDFRPSLLRAGLYHPDGQIRDEVYVYGSFLQSKMYREGVTCQDCHDPHGLHVRADGNAVCASCHLPERFDSEAHHFHDPSGPGASCVDCHMPETTYMVVDPRRDHSFRVPRPDLTSKTGSPNACTGCHADQSAEWATAAVSEWYGHDPEPHYGEAFHSAWTGAPDARSRLVAVLNDPEVSGLTKASVASLVPTPSALMHDDPLVRLGGLEGLEQVDPSTKHQLLVPLLRDPVRAVRIEAARILTSVPQARFTSEQRAQWRVAIEEYRTVQALNADWPESQANLALVHAQLGEIDQAESRYRRALALDPAFASVYVNLADLYRGTGDNRAAEELLREALTSVPEPADIHHALGLTLVRLRRVDEAVVALRTASELRPDIARYAYVYGVALQSSGDLDSAIGVLEGAIARHPYDPETLFALATMERDRGRFGDALEYARRLSALAPGDSSIQQLVAALESAVRGSVGVR